MPEQLNRIEERELAVAAIGDEFADAAERVIDYLNRNVPPNRVFDADVLQEWVAKNYAFEDVYDVDTLRVYAKARWYPDEVFGEDELAEWAIEHGYVKKQ